MRGVPVKTLKTKDGNEVHVTTAYDLLMAQYGVNRGLAGEYPADYDDAEAPYTPAWSEKYTGVGRDVLIRFAREWGTTAEHTEGKCTILIGAGINHWYHSNLMYRAGIHALMFCGCIGKNGGGWRTTWAKRNSPRPNLGPPSRWRKIGSRLRGCKTRPAGTTSIPINGDMRRTLPTITPSHRMVVPTPRPRDTRSTCKSALCARAGCHSIPSSLKTRSRW